MPSAGLLPHQPSDAFQVSWRHAHCCLYVPTIVLAIRVKFERTSYVGQFRSRNCQTWPLGSSLFQTWPLGPVYSKHGHWVQSIPLGPTWPLGPVYSKHGHWVQSIPDKATGSSLFQTWPLGPVYSRHGHWVLFQVL